MKRSAITLATGLAAVALTIAGCSAGGAGLEELDGLSLEEVADLTDGERTAPQFETDPDVDFDSASAEQWFVDSWESDPERENVEDIKFSDDVTLNLISVLEVTYDECDTGRLGDDGASLSFDTQGNDDASGDSIEDVACVLFALDMPDSIVTKVDSTRALDGTMTDEWDGITVTWNYHPDSGMNMVLEIED